uniref:Osteopetrosis-associated transmembrane protein 1 n=1 Tax=Syphacia muris TaxID=451379 RepID=A0A0N5ATQ4_9BILA
MVNCSAYFSSPPKVCINCIEEYIAIKQMEYDLKHLNNVTSLDGTPCSTVIYSNYLVSYNEEITSAVTRQIWDASQCDACINIEWGFNEQNTNYSFVNATFIFQKKLFDWRHCVANYSANNVPLLSETNYSAVCQNCLKTFDLLFDYYWDSYMNPDLDFCLDVETTMNDSMNLWHKVWHCSEDKVKDREHDWTLVLFSFAMLASITFFFYVGSYVQSERSQRNLIKYSRMELPRGVRSRLLSSSNFSDTGVNPSTSDVVL